MKMYRYRLLITGNVHRLGFRHHALECALLCGVSGFAGYLGSTVFIEAEGLPEQLKQFIEWCKKGPEGSVISKFEISEIPPLNSESFVISTNLIPALLAG